MSILVIDFSNAEIRDRFIAWLSDAGGQEDFLDFYFDEHIHQEVTFDYHKVFKEWGYNPEKDGVPTLKIKVEKR